MLVVKTPPTSAGDKTDTGSIPGSGRSPGGGNGNLLQYSCPGNPMDRGAWPATVHRVTKRQTGLSVCMHTVSVQNATDITQLCSHFLSLGEVS